MEISTRWLDSLNPRQLEAVTHGDGPLLVVAGAGTGKTRTLAWRLTYVAMTRARDFLYVLWPLRFYTRPSGSFADNHCYAQLCRFLTPEVLATMDRLGYDEAADSSSESTTDVSGGGVMDRIRGMWD